MKESGVVLRDLSVRFSLRRGLVRRAASEIRAVDGVSFEIPKGQTVGLVGESGSGKTTTGRALLGLVPLSGGSVEYFGADLKELRRQPDRLPRLAQVVFQDPYASINPRMTIRQTLSEVLTVHKLAPAAEVRNRVVKLLADVGLLPTVAERYPHALSGGQRQRVAIARALAIEPRFVVLDEVVSALDVSIQGQIVNLLQDLQESRGLTFLFISHDLSIVRHLSHRIVVLYGGQVMEIAPRDAIFAHPHHPYTAALLSAVLLADPRAERSRTQIDIDYEPPDPSAPPPGCRYQRSCRFATAICTERQPLLRPVPSPIPGSGHMAACHHMERPDVRVALAQNRQRTAA